MMDVRSASRVFWIKEHTFIILFYFFFVLTSDSFVHHYFYFEKISFTGFQVKLGANDLTLFAVIFLVGGGHGLLYGVQNFFFWNFPFFFQLFQRTLECF